MNRDVFLAILAMDSYSRGYGQSIGGLLDSGGLGLATIKSQSDIRDGSIARDAGFYAIAYDWNGETIISYRGTDDFAKDMLNGWITGIGWADGAQAKLAMEFYEAVTGRWVHSPAAPADVTLTGHSLGGGLAGLVSALSGAQALLFDHMPFGRAAIAQIGITVDMLQEGAIDPALSVSPEEVQRAIDLLQGVSEITDYAAVGLRHPDIGLPSGWFVEGEALVGVAVLGISAISALATRLGAPTANGNELRASSFPAGGSAAGSAGQVDTALLFGCRRALFSPCPRKSTPSTSGVLTRHEIRMKLAA